jgi:hypothetical protein
MSSDFFGSGARQAALSGGRTAREILRSQINAGSKKEVPLRFS